ncbi:Lysozyme c-1 [Blattella germanica]|nr:Lysozyme c-1 [Blattella germanica]PSN47214.1 Lysozyme c-1 [Blattella germanica]
MQFLSLYVLAGLMAALPYINAKVFSECELTQVLRQNGVPENELANYVCIAQFESSYNSQAVNNYNTDGSHDYGLFQLNDRYWCTHGYPGNGCNVQCENLLNDDISDDIACAKYIRQIQGFTAWVAYNNHCASYNPVVITC